VSGYLHISRLLCDTSRAAGDKPYFSFFNSRSATFLDVVVALRGLSDALDASAAKVVEYGRQGDPGIPLDQRSGKT
jgi:hypothetical protein